MNRNEYDKKVLAVFDTIAAFFTDVMYNDLYQKADNLIRQNHGSGPQSVTDAYRTNVTNYMKGIKTRPDLYMIVIKKFHEYYQRFSGFGGMVFGDFVDKIISQFIPPEYFKDFTAKNKDKTLNEILVWTVAETVDFILNPDTLSRIIDNHMDGANVTLIQDHIIDILIVIRENYYSKFASELANQNKGTVHPKVLKKLTDAISKETHLRIEAETDRDRATNMLSGCIAKIKELEKIIYQLNLKIERMEHEKTKERISIIDQDVVTKVATPMSAPMESSSRGRPKKPTISRDVKPAVSAEPVVKQKKPTKKEPTPSQSEESEESKNLDGQSDSDTGETSESTDSIDDEEMHRRQKEAIKAKRQPRSKTSSTAITVANTDVLIDDPGFG